MNVKTRQFTAIKPVAAALSAFLLASCGGGNTTSSDSSSSSSTMSSSSSQMSSSSISSSMSSSSSVSSSSSMMSSSSSSEPTSDVASILVSPGTFDEPSTEFFSDYINVAAGASAMVSYDGEIDINILDVGDNEDTPGANDGLPWYVQVTHIMSVEEAKAYTVCFKAKASGSRTLEIGLDTGPDGEYGAVSANFSFLPLLTTSYESYSSTFYSDVTDATARLTFNAGVYSESVQIDDIGIYPGTECGTPGANDDGGGGDIEGVPHISTQGNQVLFGGQQGSVAGVSMFWSPWEEGSIYYNAGAVQSLKGWGSKLVRAAMGIEVVGGYLTNRQTNLNRVRAVVDAAIANDMYVIIDWHTHYAEDYRPEAVEFFTQMAQEYGSYSNVIFEVYNEPLNVSWSNVIKPYALDVIQAIRDNDSDEHENLIIVGTPNWSQDVDAASQDPITNFSNIAYTLHFYAGTHQNGILAKAQTALGNGIPLFVTEWGTVGASGDGAVNTEWTNRWMNFLRTNNISHANWSLSWKDEGASILKPSAQAKPTGGWTDADLTQSGLLVKGIIENW